MSHEDSDEREEDELAPMFEYSHNLVVQIKRQLTVHGKVYLGLPKVEEGFVKKMRFTIVTLCPECGGANHVQHVDQDMKENECDVCQNSQKVFATKTDIFSVYAPVGTRHGSTILLQDEGSFGPQGIRGDIVVTFLDEPHEHFLRIFDDIIVCFKINREESASGVVRLLTLAVPTPQDIVLKTEDGEPISNNEARYVSGLGLPNCHDKQKRGKLIIVFIVKEQRSMFPVKLNDIKMSFNSVDDTVPTNEGKASDGTFQSAVLTGLRPEDSTAPKTNGLKIKSRAPRRQNPRKRRKGAFIEGKASTSSDSLSTESDSPTKLSKDRVSSPLNPPSVDADTEEAQVRCSRILDNPFERLTASEIESKDPLDTKKLSFLDRIVYLRTIPLPYKTQIKDAIPMSKLLLLWERIYDPLWWQRAQWTTQSLSKDPDTLMRELFPTKSPTQSDDRNSFANTPVFDVREGKIDEAAEALKFLCTTQSCCNTEYPRFNPQKLSKNEKRRLLERMKRYLQETVS